MSFNKAELHLGKGQRYQLLLAQIIRGIKDGSLKAGDKLPTHRQLARQLEVSVGTVAKAYLEAQRQGWLEARVGAGTYIRRHSQADILRLTDDRDRVRWDLGLTNSLLDRQPQLVQRHLQAITQDGALLPELLQYQPSQGMEHQRQVVAEHLLARGVQAGREQLLLTNGAQHALAIALQCLCRPGDTVLAEGLSYPGLISLAQHQGLQLHGLALDLQGVVPDALEQAITATGAKVLYLSPTLQTPTNAVMSLERRLALVAIARRHGLTIIEDDNNGALNLGQHVPLQQLLPARVWYLAGLSKQVAAGLRFGYLVVPAGEQEQARDVARASGFMAAPLMMELGCRLLASGDAAQAMADLQKEIQQRARLMQRIFAGTDLRHSSGAFYGWLPLPPGVGADELAARAEAEGIRVLTAGHFAVGQFQAPQAIRLSLTLVQDRARLREALGRLRQLLP
ncbi:PLP-dependent aminotransferase family protein [Gallaecimonas sp. GXIMD4217]|uniref:aminotransferase-like domain-containing protein n=1 Tax=Gallaecimonas sp. GXIMD4217 TaxID=3131927 RepID=UPI00311AEFB2